MMLICERPGLRASGAKDFQRTLFAAEIPSNAALVFLVQSEAHVADAR